MSDTKQQLREMAQLAILSGRISEVHEKNLKMYPFIFFEGVDTCTIDYDLSREGESLKHWIAYHLTLDMEANKGISMDKRFSAIEQAIRTLLWNDIEVQVHLNGKKFEREAKDV